MTPIRTVADLIAALQVLDPALPVGVATYNPNRLVAGHLTVWVEKRRQASRETVDTFDGRMHWFELDTPQALYHEERGGGLETVVVLGDGP